MLKVFLKKIVKFADTYQTILSHKFPIKSAEENKKFAESDSFSQVTAGDDRILTVISRR